MKILVTGGNGFLGRHLRNDLILRGHTVYSCDLVNHRDQFAMRCDVRDFRRLDDVIAASNPDLVYHLAAEFGRHNGEDFYPDCWSTNVIGTKNLIRLQERTGFKMVFFSSSEVYGDYPAVMREDVMDEVEIRQLNDYAISKWVGEQMVMNSAARFQTETVRVRLFNSYGPGEVWTPYRSMVAQFVYLAITGQALTVFKGYRRTSTYVADTIHALGNIASMFYPGEVYNIAGDENHQVIEVAERVLNVVGNPEARIELEDEDTHNTVSKYPYNARAKERIGLVTTVGIDEGIARTVSWARQWYKENGTGREPARRAV